MSGGTPRATDQETWNNLAEWRKYFKGFYYDEAGQLIMHEGGMFLDLRGWGWLTGTGANNLPEKEAAKIQDEAGRDVAKLLNEAPALAAELTSLKKTHNETVDFYNDDLKKAAARNEQLEKENEELKDRILTWKNRVDVLCDLSEAARLEKEVERYREALTTFRREAQRIANDKNTSTRVQSELITLINSITFSSESPTEDTPNTEKK